MKCGDLRFCSAARRERFARCTEENRGRMSGSRKPTGAYEARRLAFLLGGAPGTVRAVYRREPRTGEWKHRRESMKCLRFRSAARWNGRTCDGVRRYAGRSAGALARRGGIERRRADLRVPARRRTGNGSRGVPKGTMDGRVEASTREYEVLAFPLGGALERPYLRRRTAVRWPKRWRVGMSRRC